MKFIFYNKKQSPLLNASSDFKAVRTAYEYKSLIFIYLTVCLCVQSFIKKKSVSICKNAVFVVLGMGI